MSDSSDSDEGPEQLSFEKGKALAATELEMLKSQKQNDLRIAKLKRRLRQEEFIAQKKLKAKELEKEMLFSTSILDELRTEAINSMSQIPVDVSRPLANSTTDSVPDYRQSKKHKAGIKKVYKGLNIEVTTLSAIKSTRAIAAANFREKRLAKVRRESPNVNLIHAEKLAAAGKL